MFQYIYIYLPYSYLTNCAPIHSPVTPYDIQHGFSSFRDSAYKAKRASPDSPIIVTLDHDSRSGMRWPMTTGYTANYYMFGGYFIKNI